MIAIELYCVFLPGLKRKWISRYVSGLSSGPHEAMTERTIMYFVHLLYVW